MSHIKNAVFMYLMFCQCVFFGQIPTHFRKTGSEIIFQNNLFFTQ